MLKANRLLTLFLILQASVAFGARFAKDVQFEGINDASGGLYTASKAHKIPHNFSPNMKNVYVDETYGTVVGGNGFTALGSTNSLANIRFVHVYNKADGSKEFIVNDGSSIYKTVDGNSYILLRTGYNSLFDLKFVTARGKVYWSNGFDAVASYDGSTVTVLDGSTGTVPNIPRAKYLAYYQDRLWVCNINTDDSLCNYSLLTDTNGVILALDDPRSWPAYNFLPIGQGDGTVITWVKIFNSYLRIGKEESTFTVFGTEKNSYRATRTVGVGYISDLSVQELDNRLLGQTRNGVYEFDGNNMRPLTDRITPNVSTWRADKSRTINNTWDTHDQFIRGAAFYGTTPTVDGFLTLRLDTFTINTIGVSSPADNNITMLSDTISLSTYVVYVPSSVPDASYIAVNPKITVWEKANGLLARKFTAKNIRTGGEWYVFEKNSPLSFQQFSYDLKCSTMPNSFWNSSDISGGSFEIQIKLLNYSFPGTDTEACEASGINGDPPPGSAYSVFTASNPTYAQINLSPSATGQYVSEVTSVPVITAWGAFNASAQNNGGTINYYVKFATSLVNIATQTFMQTSPGAILNSSASYHFVVWASSLYGTNLLNPPAIDRVDVSHIEGSVSNTRSFASVWMNRYWLWVATETSGNFPQLYIKTLGTNPTPDGWMPFDGINMRSAVTSDGIFYGGGAASGAFYRLDYGTDYNGMAIDQYYETPDLLLGSDFEDKTLLEYMIDVDRGTGMNLTVGTYVNGGTLRSTNYSIDGTGRALKNIYNIDKTGRYFRVRIENSQLDQTLMWHGINLAYRRIRLQ